MDDVLSIEKSVLITAKNIKIRTGTSRGVRRTLISLLIKTNFASQAKNPKETKKNKRYCLLNSYGSKEKGKKKTGNKKTNAYMLKCIILLRNFSIKWMTA